MNIMSDGENRELHYHYWNTQTENGGVGIYIVAAVNFYPKEEGKELRRTFDWAVYLGASLFGSHQMEVGIQWAAQHGGKLSLEQAKHWFTYLPEDRYRN